MAKIDLSRYSDTELREKLAKLRSERHGAVSTSGPRKKAKKRVRKDTIEIDLDAPFEEEGEPKDDSSEVELGEL